MQQALVNGDIAYFLSNNGHGYVKIHIAGNINIFNEYSNHIIESEAFFNIKELFNRQ